jgi:sulfonate transport system permease protein
MPQLDRSPEDVEELDAVGSGLDALDAPVGERRPSFWKRFAWGVLPPLGALVLLIVVWQILWAAAFWSEAQLPAPIAVWDEFWGIVVDGQVFGFVWTSVHRAALGFVAGVLIGTPLGLLVAKVRVVRAAIGPLLTGLQSLPSVAWVPAAILWFGINDAAIYFVVLLGSVPSIANGLVSGIDQIPPILPRVGQVMGANRLGVLVAVADGGRADRAVAAAGCRARRVPEPGFVAQQHRDGDRGDLPDPAGRRRDRAGGLPAAGTRGAAGPRPDFVALETGITRD